MIFPLGSIYVGIDTEQVTALRGWSEDDAIDSGWLHTSLGFEPNQQELLDPGILCVKCDSPSRRYIVTQPIEIVRVTIEDINPLPKLIEPWARELGLWSIVMYGTVPVFILDFTLVK